MINLVEVGPRDGLQNESETIPTAVKVAFVDALSKTGVSEIEVSAFVSPAWVPQLFDADDVFAQIERRAGVTYSALVPNMRGMTRAIAARVDKISIFTAASNSFTQKNVNATIDETFVRFAPVVEAARAAKMQVRGYVSTSFWCPYEGFIEAERVLDVVLRLIDLGVDEVSLGDTIGKAVPDEVVRLLDILLPHIAPKRLAMHFHDTYGRALANVMVAFERGVTTFDASVGGLGGCPYAPGAPGNVATSAVVRALRGRGAHDAIDLTQLRVAGNIIAPYIRGKHGFSPGG